MDKKVKVGIVGTGFVGDIHHMSFRDWVPNAEVVAVSSPNNADAICKNARYSQCVQRLSKNAGR